MYFMSLSELYGYIDRNEPKGFVGMFKSDNAAIKAAVNELAKKYDCKPWSLYLEYELQRGDGKNPTFAFEDIAPIITKLVSNNPSGCQKDMLTGAIRAYFVVVLDSSNDLGVNNTTKMLNNLKDKNSLTVENITIVRDIVKSLGSNIRSLDMAEMEFEKVFSAAPRNKM